MVVQIDRGRVLVAGCTSDSVYRLEVSAGVCAAISPSEFAGIVDEMRAWHPGAVARFAQPDWSRPNTVLINFSWREK